MSIDITKTSIVKNSEGKDILLQPGDVICFPFWPAMNVTHHMACYIGTRDNIPVIIDKWGPSKMEAAVTIRPLQDITGNGRDIIKVEYEEKCMYPREERINNLLKEVGKKGWSYNDNCQHFINRCVLRCPPRWTEGEWAGVLGLGIIGLGLSKKDYKEWFLSFPAKILAHIG